MIFFVFYFVYPLVVLVELFYTLFLKNNHVPPVIIRLTQLLAVAVFPCLFFVMLDTGERNDCCDHETVFSPQHRLTIYAMVFICAAAYFFSVYRKNIAPPLLEIAVNSLLLAGIILCVFITIQFKEDDRWGFAPGTGSVIVLFAIALIKNQRLLLSHFEQTDLTAANALERFCWRVLQLNPFIKTPIFILLCLPLMVIITGILLLLGQKPDSLIRAFTDTYYHGFSILNHECDNVQCGGHYLCSVAANGHRQIVKPQRLGERNGHKIICNRQLLVSNAFEQLVQQKLPFMHKPIRKAYNHVGNLVHRYYGIFNNKYVADAVYILMKPLEWFFILVLYTFDRNPENRIAQQYVSIEDTQRINGMMKKGIAPVR
jgi:hypothetical protein